MPSQTVKNGLFKKLGTKLTSAVKKHAHDEINYGRVDLPPGIKNGVAQLTKCYFKQYENGDNKGEYYFRAEGVVVKPKEVATQDGSMKVEGLTTSIMMPVCETKNSKGETKSIEENAAKVINEMKKLGADADEMAESPENLEEIAAALQEAKPYFKFTTSAGKTTKEFPNPRTWENWNGIIEDFDPDTSDDVEDETGDQEEAADVEEEEAPKAKPGKKPTSKAPKEDEPADDEEAEETEEEGDDLAALAATADDSDDDGHQAAQKKLATLAKAAGISQKKIDDANSWTHLAGQIQKAQGTEEEAEEVEDETAEEDEAEEEEAYTPAKDDIVKYKSKKDKKPMEYEVVASYKKTSTCDLKSIDDGKTVHKNIKWADVTEVK